MRCKHLKSSSTHFKQLLEQFWDLTARLWRSDISHSLLSQLVKSADLCRRRGRTVAEDGPSERHRRFLWCIWSADVGQFPFKGLQSKKAP